MMYDLIGCWINGEPHRSRSIENTFDGSLKPEKPVLFLFFRIGEIWWSVESTFAATVRTLQGFDGLGYPSCSSRMPFLKI